MLLLAALAGATELHLDAFDAALDAAEGTGGLYGEVLVLDGEREVYRRRLGGAPEGGRYRIGSISKSVTAATVLSLVEEGRVGLDTPIVEVLPEVVELADPPVTVRQLLSHTSGLPGLDIAPWGREPTFDEWLVGVRVNDMLKLDHPPGEVHAYSNGGYLLLSEAIRRLDGGAYQAAAKRRVLGPLGLHSFGLPPRPDDVPGTLVTAAGRLEAQRMLPHLLQEDFRWDLGGSGAWSATVDDLAGWGVAWRDGRLLDPTLREAAITPVRDGYAFGWVRADDGHVWHNGAISPLGVYAYVRWSPDDDIVVAWANAVDLSSVTPEVRQLTDHLFEGDGPALATRGGPMATLAFLSWLRTPWWIALALLGPLFVWARRPGRSRMALASAGMTAGGLALFALAPTGGLGVLVALMGTSAAVAGPWGGAARTRPTGWPALAALGALTLSGGVGFAGLVLGLYSLVGNAWPFFAALQP